MICQLARKAAIAAFLLVMLALGRPALAQDLITERAWFDDPTGTLTLDQVRNQTFTPYRSVLSRGVGDSVVWVRLRIDPSRIQRNDNGTRAQNRGNARTPGNETASETANEGTNERANERIALKIRPVYLDRIELFDPLDPRDEPRVSGDLSAASNEEIQSLTFGFLLPLGSAPRDIYLKLSSESTRILYAEAMLLTELSNADRTLQIASGVYMGVSILFLLWGVIMWLLGRDRLTLTYVLSQLSMVFFGLCVFGYVRYFAGDWLGPVAVSHLTTLSGVSSVVASILFYHELYREYSPPTWGIRFIQFGYALFFLEVALVLLDNTRLAVQINWSYLSFLPFVAFTMAFFCKGWDKPNPEKPLLPKTVIAGYFGVFLFLYVYLAASSFWALDGGAMSIYTGLGNGITSGVLAFVLLQYRAAIKQRAQSRMSTELAVSKSSAEKEREHRMDQERLMAMLAHEIRTPLSVIALSLNQQTQDPARSQKLAQEAIRDIDDIIDQCLDVDLLNLNQLGAVIQPVLLEKTVSEVKERISALEPRLAVTGTLQTWVQSDPRLLRVILINLLNNALRYGAADQPIVLDVQSTEPNQIEISVSNGLGPAGAPDANRIFDKYYRAPSAQRYSGTGLGLYLAQGIAQKLGGKLRYAFHNNRIQFTLCLPLTTKA